jgi:hypothetical protein
MIKMIQSTSSEDTALRNAFGKETTNLHEIDGAKRDEWHDTRDPNLKPDRGTTDKFYARRTVFEVDDKGKLTKTATACLGAKKEDGTRTCVSQRKNHDGTQDTTIVMYPSFLQSQYTNYRIFVPTTCNDCKRAANEADRKRDKETSDERAPTHRKRSRSRSP